MDNQTATAGKQTKGIKKLWLKFKASMKTDQANTSKSSVAPTTAKPTTSTTSAPVAKPAVSEPAPAQVPESNDTTEQPVAQPESKKAIENTKPAQQPAMNAEPIQVDDDEEEEEDVNEKIQMPSMRPMSSDKEATAMRYQRAQDVFKKYNMEIEPADWQQADNSSVPRVEKKTRMRVRYTCHECKQTFGRDKKCSGCSHMRCSSCVRYPAKRTGDRAKQSKQIEAIPSTLAAPTTGACHECKTNFNLGATECENCNHQICSRCLKETVMASPATAPPPAQPVAVAAAS